MSLNRKEADGTYTEVAGFPYVTKENIGLSKVENKSPEELVTMTMDASGYVTPEAFGAVGDGTTDDTEALQATMDAGKSVVLSTGKVYAISDAVYVKTGTVIYGNNAVVKSINNNVLLTIDPNQNNIRINDVKFECQNDIHCICINIPERDLTTDEYDSAYDIEIRGCDLKRGIFGIIATKASDIRIINCHFSDFIYNPDDVAGGYGILLQRCKNVAIDKCTFDNVNNGRHDVYISCAGSKEHENNCCRDITIRDCVITHDTQTFYSPNTPAFMIRHSYNVTIDNVRASDLMCLVATDANQGEIKGLKVLNCYVENITGHYGSAESKGVFEIWPGCEVEINGNRASRSDDTTYPWQINFISAFGSSSKSTTVVAQNNICDGWLGLQIGNNTTVIIDNIISNSTKENFLNFTGEGTVKGYIRNVRVGGGYANMIRTENHGIINKTLFEKSVYAIPIYDGEVYRTGSVWLNPTLSFNSTYNQFTLNITALATSQYINTVAFKPNPVRTGYTLKTISYDGQKLVFELYNASGNIVTDKSRLSGVIELV